MLGLNTKPLEKAGVWSKLYTAAGSHYALYLLPSVLRTGVGLLLIPVTTYFLSPVDFGVFAFIGAIVIPVKAVAATGARWVLGGNYYRVPEPIQRLMLFNILVSEVVLRTLIIVVLAIFAEPVLKAVIVDYRPEYKQFLYINLAATWAGSLWPVVSFFMTLQDRPRSFALLSSVQVLANALTIVGCLVILGLGVEALFLGALAASLFSLVLELCYVWRFVAFSVERRWLREILQTGLRATPGGLAELVANMADKLFIQRWAGLGTLGLYSHSQQYQSIFRMLTAAFSNTFTPASLRIYTGDRNAASLGQMLSLWYGILGVAGVVFALFMDNLVTFLTHGKFVGSAPLVLIWYLAVFIVSHGIPYAGFLIAQKRSRVLMYTQLIPTICGIGLVAVGAYYYGIFGAAWAILVTSMTVQMVRRMVAGRLGYRGVAERRFAEAVSVYLLLWMLNGHFGWPFLTKVSVSAVLVPALIVRFDLVRELWHRLSTKERVQAAE